MQFRINKNTFLDERKLNGLFGLKLFVNEFVYPYFQIVSIKFNVHTKFVTYGLKNLDKNVFLN